MGLYQNEQGGFACLVDQQRGTASQTGTLEHYPEQDLSRRNDSLGMNWSLRNRGLWLDGEVDGDVAELADTERGRGGGGGYGNGERR